MDFENVKQFTGEFEDIVQKHLDKPFSSVGEFKNRHFELANAALRTYVGTLIPGLTLCTHAEKEKVEKQFNLLQEELIKTTIDNANLCVAKINKFMERPSEGTADN